MKSWIESAKESADNCLEDVEKDLKSKIYSNIYDKEGSGHQYIDLVCEGGGMLGIALVGYTYILEKVGLKFRSIAGTSAGAINALMLAAVKPDLVTKRKSDKLLEIMGEKNFFDFVDGDGKEDNEKAVKKVISEALKGKRWSSLWKYPFKLKKSYNNVKSTNGLNNGDNFYDWIDDILTRESVDSTKALKKRMNDYPELFKRTENEERVTTIGEAKLKVVATDITTESRAIFPEQAGVYFNDPEEVNPAHYVRASMSIPVFFKPYICKHPSQDITKWESIKNFSVKDFKKREDGKPDIPKIIYFVDGGLISNFPFDILHTPSGNPSMPTFGVKLEVDYRSQTFESFFGYLGAILNASRHSLDNKYNQKYTKDYDMLVKEIQIPESISWLDFNMSDTHKIKLFKEGAKAAVEFLEEFDWEKYYEFRSTKNI